MIKTYSLFLLLATSMACTKRSKNLPVSQPLITFDMTSLDQHRVTAPVIKNRKFIPLESHEDVIIGKIRKVLIQDQRIYVFDKVISKALFVFDIEGNFLFRVSKRGKGPGEYLYLSDFDLDEQGNIYLMNGNGLGFEIMKFDHSGKFISKRQNSLFWATAFAHPNKENLACFTRNSKKHEFRGAELAYQVLYTDTEDITGQYIPDSKFVDSDLAVKMPLYFYKSSPDNYLYASIFDYDIYQVGPKGLSKKYAFDFDSKALPEDVDAKREIVKSIQGSDKYVWLFKYIYEDDDFLTFKFTIDGSHVKFYYSKKHDDFFIKDWEAMYFEEGNAYINTLGIYQGQIVGALEAKNLIRIKEILADPDSYRYEDLKKQDTSFLDGVGDLTQTNPIIVLYEIDWSVLENKNPA